MSDLLDSPGYTEPGVDDAAPGYVPPGEPGAYGDTGEIKPEVQPDAKHDERRPIPHEPRKSVADIAGPVAGFLGMGLVQSKIDPPVGRVIQFEAPLIGDRFDALIAGTWLDRLLQPFVGKADAMKGLGSLLAFPLLIAVYERNPATEPIVYPMLRDVIGDVAGDLAPMLKKAKAKADKQTEAAAELSEVFKGLNMPEGMDHIDAVLWMVLRPDLMQAPPTPPPPPEGAENGNQPAAG